MDGQHIGVLYVEAPENRSLVGTEGVVTAQQVSAFSPAPPGSDWGKRVTVLLHRVPETEEWEGGYEAVTMGGVPLGVSIAATDEDAAHTALDRLLGALAAFGYSGRVDVQDATLLGSIRLSEAEVP